MPIDSSRPVKACKFCKKEVQNLAMHIINQHPSIVEQLEEGEVTMPSSVASLPVESSPQRPKSVISEDTEALIHRKLNILMDIQIIKALGAGAGLADIKQLITPQNTQLADVIALHNQIYPKEEAKTNINVTGEAGNWIEIAKLALPIVNKMIPEKRTEETQQNDTARVREDEERPISVLRPIQEQVTGDTIESDINREESGAPIQAERPIDSSYQANDSGAPGGS